MLLRRQRRLFFGIIFVLVMVVYLPLIMNQVAVSGDYAAHGFYAMMFSEGKLSQVSPHALHFVLAALVNFLTNANHVQSLGLVVLVHYSMAGVLIAFMLAQALQYRIKARQFALIIALALILLTIAPLALEMFSRPSRVLFGYFSTSPHHNPTNMIARFYALLTLWLAVRAYGNARPSNAYIIGSAALVVLSAFAKPSWVIVFLPALLVYTAWRFLTRQTLQWYAVLGGFILPAFVVLAWQYGVSIGSWSADTGRISLEPFAYMTLRGDTLPILAAKFMLSIPFPLAVTVAYWHTLREKVSVHLAWLAFGMGALQAYLLIMDGTPQMRIAGDWTWGALLAVFVLFAIMAYHWVQENAPILQGQAPVNRRFVVTGGMLVLHSAFGVLWYLAHIHPVNILLQ